MNRQTVVTEALDLLDDVGLEMVCTRRLAKRLGVEQPSLYSHIRTKKDLLDAMAAAAMAPHANARLPSAEDDWRAWFLENSRSFRRTLLMRRDGARLHAGSTPTGDLDRIRRKMAFLVSSGVPEREALLDLSTPLGHDYWHLMNLAGQYAYAGREWVARKVVGILGGTELELVHNHHNFAWRETHGGESVLPYSYAGTQGLIQGNLIQLLRLIAG